jgi:hypothetical protein
MSPFKYFLTTIDTFPVMIYYRNKQLHLICVGTAEEYTYNESDIPNLPGDTRSALEKALEVVVEY